MVRRVKRIEIKQKGAIPFETGWALVPAGETTVVHSGSRAELTGTNG